MKAALVFLASLAVLGFAPLQVPDPTLAVTAPPKQVQAGTKLTLKVNLTFAPGYHGYQNPPASEYEIPVTVKVDSKEFKVSKIAYPAGEDASVGGSEKPTKTYAGKVTIPVTVTVPTKPGVKTLKVVASYQQCDETSCFAPAEVATTVKINVVKKVTKG